MKQFIITDVHGCADTFNELLNKIGLSKSDELFLLGDYISRGLKSKDVIDTIIQYQSDGYQITSLRGNHEDMLLGFYSEYKRYKVFLETLLSFGINSLEELPDDYRLWFENLDHYTTEKQFILVHAGLNFRKDNPFDDKENMLWIRDWHQQVDFSWLGNRKIVHGHTPIEKSKIVAMRDQLETNQFIDLDNGCYMKGEKDMGNLCCMELNSKELYFQENIDKVVY